MRCQPLAHLSLLVTAMLPVHGLAQSCDAYYTFDGTLSDSGRNGYDGEMIGEDGGTGVPQFAPGRSGQALRLDGSSAMRALVDLHFDACPQVTIAAWIQHTGAALSGSADLVSTGSGNGPGISTLSNSLVLKGTANGLLHRDAIRPNAGWTFVAGVYDYSSGEYTLYVRNRSDTKKMGEKLRPPQDALWVGAFDDKLANAAADFLIDDLRIYGRALSAAEINTIRSGGGATGADSCSFPDVCYQPPGGSLDTRSTAVATMAAPPVAMPSAEGAGVTAEDTPQQVFMSGTLPTSDTGSGLPRQVDSAAGALKTNTLSDETVNALGEARGDTSPLDLAYESEEEGLAAAEAAAARRAEEQRLAEQAGSAAGSTTSPGGYTLGDEILRSPVAGFSGTTSIPIDFVDEPIEIIRIMRGDDSVMDAASKPIDVEIESPSGRKRDATNFATTEKVVVGQRGAVIGAVRACTNVSNDRLTGLRIEGNYLDSDGAWGEYFAQSDESRPFCTLWHETVRCPDVMSVATGVVVHFRNATINADKVVGIQLLCRMVVQD